MSIAQGGRVNFRTTCWCMAVKGNCVSMMGDASNVWFRLAGAVFIVLDVNGK
jgi:hypothetical protein